jgi:hypothetical protein
MSKQEVEHSIAVIDISEEGSAGNQNNQQQPQLSKEETYSRL